MDFSLLTPSDWIALFSTIVTLFTSVVAVFISFAALKQSSDLIKESNLPKISIYADIVTSGHFQEYLIIQNYGGASTKVASITYSSGLHELDIQFLENLVGSVIIPGQKIIHSLINPDDKINKINIHITYGSVKRNVSESFTIDLNRLSNTFYTTSESNARSQSEIVQTLHTLNNTAKQMSHNFEKQNL